jgi:hypothetical protein
MPAPNKGHQQMGGNLAEKRDDGNRHQDDQQQHGAADPDPGLTRNMAQPWRSQSKQAPGIDFTAFAGEGRRRHGKCGVSFMRGC